MATGGIFQLITNDGRQDRMLMATGLLKKRLELIQRARAADPTVTDATPTLVDIEKTHILFTNAHFKPFAAIGYEYNKVRVSSGSPTPGSTVQFSIPQFGDFFHDMVLHVQLQQPTLTVTAQNQADAPSMRWCPFPGERLMKKVQFEVNGNPLDEYTSHAYNFHREYCVPPHKRTGWYRCVGQELPWHGTLDQPGDNGAGQSAAAAGSYNHRFAVEVLNGFQTPTTQKDTSKLGDLDLFIPLLFWFNKDPRLSIPSVAIPFGQRFVNIELAQSEDLVNLWPRGAGTFANPLGSLDRSTSLVRSIELYINNIFVNPEIHDIFIKRIGFTLIRVHRQQITSCARSSEDVQLQQLKWPIETLFIGMKIRDYNSSDTTLRAANLDKWHRFSKVTKQQFLNEGMQGYRQLALTLPPGATITVAANGAVAGAGGTSFLVDLLPGDILVGPAGQTFTVDTVAGAAAAAVVVAPLLPVTGTAWYALRSGPQAATAEVMQRTVDTFTIKAHGIPLYNEFPAAFYNAYVPYHYGGPNVQTPEDLGAMMVNFCLYPGTYQPSGHINVSRAREFYFAYTSSVIDSSTEGTLVILASAINFLLISDGSAVLRYST